MERGHNVLGKTLYKIDYQIVKLCFKEFLLLG